MSTPAVTASPVTSERSRWPGSGLPDVALGAALAAGGWTTGDMDGAGDG